MIRITNAQASGFLSPIISELFNDKSRKFPIAAAFKIADLIQQIQVKAKLYQDHARKVIESYGGTIDDKGRVFYNPDVDQQSVSMELDDLNNIEVELIGEKLNWSEKWPDLSVHEAFILSPLINQPEE